MSAIEVNNINTSNSKQNNNIIKNNNLPNKIKSENIFLKKLTCRQCKFVTKRKKFKL